MKTNSLGLVYTETGTVCTSCGSTDVVDHITGPNTSDKVTICWECGERQ